MDAVDPTVITSPGRGTGRGRSSRASAMLNTAVFAPMPMASDRMATIVKPGFFRIMRRAYRRSCAIVSNGWKARRSLYVSFVLITPPKLREAASVACRESMPARMLSSACISRWKRISASSSRSRRLRRNSARIRAASTLRRLTRSPSLVRRGAAQGSVRWSPPSSASRRFLWRAVLGWRGGAPRGEGFGRPPHPLPVAGFFGELFSAGGGERIELGLAILLRRTPLAGDPPFLLHAEERGVQRALVEVQEISADLFNPSRNPIPVEGTKRLQRAQHEQDERALQDIRFLGPATFHLETYRNERIGRWGRV